MYCWSRDKTLSLNPLQRRRPRTHRYSRDPEVDRSLRHSVKDGVAYSVMTGSGETYFSAYAIMLKASAGQIGLLAALPQLVASVAQLLSAWIGHRVQRRLPIILFGAILQCLSWIPMVVLPLLFPDYAVALMIVSVILYFFGANLAVPQWSSLMGDLVHKRRRGRYFALRTRLASITAFLSMIFAGLLLHFFDEQGYVLAGFITVFVLAMSARLVSIYHLKKMHDPPGHTAALEMPDIRLWRHHVMQSPFARFSLFNALMQGATAIASPFFAVYMLRDLQYSYLEFMSCAAMTILAQFLTLNTWGRISDIFGNRLVLVISGSLIPVLPVLWTLSTEHWYLMMLQGLGGLFWAGFSLSAGNFIYDALAPQKRVTLMAL
ncbi:MFS transporter, partial [Kaarinaea lacus]